MDSIISILCPCIKSSSPANFNGHGHGRGHETELTSQNNNGNGNGDDINPSLASLYKISKSMSAPTIQIHGLNVKGHGLALVDVSIEQDCAYWEWHIETSTSTSNNNSNDEDDDDDFFNQGMVMKFGVATKKNRDFYKALNNNEVDDAMPMEDGTALMKPIQNIQNGDTIGIAVQQDDLPMIQFFLNGEPLHEIAINRFRGMVFPSLFIDGEEDEMDNDQGVNVKFVWKEHEFKEMSPSVRFKPLMAAIGII